MKNALRIKSALLATAAIALVMGVGCARSQSPEAKAKATSETKPSDSEELSMDSNDPIYLSDRAADRGEELMLPESFDKALESFELSLKLNPKNSRASFWTAYLKIQFELKGAMTRISPIFEKLPNGTERYQRLVENSLRSQSEGLRRFYLSGPKDITTDEQFQEWVDRVLLRLTEAREKLHELKAGPEFAIKVPRSNIDLGGNTGSRSRCAGKFGPIYFQAAECDATNYEIYLNRADLEVLSYSLAQLHAQVAFLNSYRLDKEAAARAIDGREESTGAFWVAKWINSGEASLRGKAGIDASQKALRDLGLAMQWLYQNQKTVCPQGRLSRKNRPGYLFAFGVCTQAFAGGGPREEWVAGTLESLINNANVSSSRLKDQIATYDIDLKKFFSEPPTSLSNLARATVKCNRISQLNEQTLRPYFINGSANELLNLKTSGCYGQEGVEP